MPQVASNGGKDHCVLLVNYQPHRAGQLLANEVLIRYGLSAPMGAWRSPQGLESGLQIEQHTKRVFCPLSKLIEECQQQNELEF